MVHRVATESSMGDVVFREEQTPKGLLYFMTGIGVLLIASLSLSVVFRDDETTLTTLIVAVVVVSLIYCAIVFELSKFKVTLTKDDKLTFGFRSNCLAKSIRVEDISEASTTNIHALRDWGGFGVRKTCTNWNNTGYIAKSGKGIVVSTNGKSFTFNCDDNGTLLGLLSRQTP
mmetsp:Transcript_12706/g.22646  ORF Transcript_12706/g.22646 Transcript_12706/m.22646 type:complete len:173 (-) Transcript_12706:198-716(-)